MSAPRLRNSLDSTKIRYPLTSAKDLEYPLMSAKDLEYPLVSIKDPKYLLNPKN